LLARIKREYVFLLADLVRKSTTPTVSLRMAAAG